MIFLINLINFIIYSSVNKYKYKDLFILENNIITVYFKQISN